MLVLKWDGTAFNNQCAMESITYNINNFTDQRTLECQCGDFSVSATKEIIPDITSDDGENTTIIESTLTFEAIYEITGRTIVCTAIGDTQPVDIVLSKYLYNCAWHKNKDSSILNVGRSNNV